MRRNDRRRVPRPIHIPFVALGSLDTVPSPRIKRSRGSCWGGGAGRSRPCAAAVRRGDSRRTTPNTATRKVTRGGYARRASSRPIESLCLCSFVAEARGSSRSAAARHSINGLIMCSPKCVGRGDASHVPPSRRADRLVVLPRCARAVEDWSRNGRGRCATRWCPSYTPSTRTGSAWVAASLD
jgi:hypothetical protein